MSGSIESLRATLRVTEGACNDHDFICRCKPVDVRFALAEIERLRELVRHVKALLEGDGRMAQGTKFMLLNELFRNHTTTGV